MNLIKLLAVFVLIFGGSFFKGYAQQLESIHVDLQARNQSLREILEQIESKYPIRFYFQATDLPPKTYSHQFESTPLPQVLTRLLSGTSLGYLPYRSYAVVIAPVLALGQNHDAHYYSAWEETLNAVAQPLTENEEEGIWLVGDKNSPSPTGKARITGTIRDAESQERLTEGSILIPALRKGSNLNESGEFVLTLDIGTYKAQIQALGYERVEAELIVFGDGTLSLSLNRKEIELDEVVVSAEAANANVMSNRPGITRLDVEAMRRLPALMGEIDVVQTLLMQPGVSTVGEGATGFNVRGGDVDQNLIMQDEGFVFNPSHALGFFSTFNPDLIGEVALYKGNVPATFGGRLASVLDVKLRDGNFKRFKANGGIGPVASRLSLEGPIVKDKTSFILAGRSSYSDWILQQINVPEVQNSSAFFYDVNAQITHRFNDKHALILSGYASQDEFVYNNQFGFDYQTLMGQLRYQILFSDKWFSRLSVTGHQYTSQLRNLEGEQGAELETGISYVKVKELITYTPSRAFRVEAGLSGIYYQVQPGIQKPLGTESLINAESVEEEQGIEAALFGEVSWELSSFLSISAGFRMVLYQYLGPQTVQQYATSDAPDVNEVVGTTVYNRGQAIATYTSPEPRFSLRYNLNDKTSIKFGYSRMAQFLNQISNTASPAPNSIWQLSNSHIEPQRAHNLSVGIFRNMGQNRWETSLEVYYRAIDELFDYRDFAELNVNEHVETELLPGIGRAYGLELSLKKNQGTVNGWISYTLARTERQVEGINLGDWYPSNFDKLHDLSVVTNIEFNRRHSLTVNFSFRTGRPTTYPVSGYRLLNGLLIPDYSQRNQVRIPDYHRLDIAYTFGKGFRRTAKVQTSWTVSIYNVYSRRNAFSVFFTQRPFQRPVANRLAILGGAFPSLTLNFEIL